jgi:FAD/FMN-containing dehydrogenase
MTERVHREDPNYETVRQSMVWNDLVPDRRPDVIVSPTSAEDVAALTREAAQASRRIAVKSGGHNWLGSALRAGGMLIDLGGLNSVDVDPGKRTAVVGPGATHKVLANAIVPRRLAFPIGHCPSVGVGGYLLAGGMGWNLHEWGPGCWNVLGADVVLADGAQAHIDADSDPDLFWALRGGSAAFPGIVTRFQLALRPLPEIRSQRTAVALRSLPTLLPRVSERLGVMPPGIEMSLIARPARPALGQDAVVNLVATAFADDERAAVATLDEALQDLTDDLDVIESSGVLPVQLNELEGEGGWTDGLRYAVDTCLIDEDFSDVGALSARATESAPSPLSRTVFAFGHMPEPDGDAAFTRLGALTVNVYATWESDADDDVNSEWVRLQMRDLEPLIRGYYVGETDLAVDPDRAKKAYAPGNWDRLNRLIADRDPDGRFYTFLSD